MAAGATANDIENMLTGFNIDADVTPIMSDFAAVQAEAANTGSAVVENTSYTQEAEILT